MPCTNNNHHVFKPSKADVLKMFSEDASLLHVEQACKFCDAKRKVEPPKDEENED